MRTREEEQGEEQKGETAESRVNSSLARDSLPLSPDAAAADRHRVIDWSLILGIALFVWTVCITSCRGSLSSMRGRWNLLVICMCVFC